MADKTMSVSLTLPLDGAPEVKGTAGYLTPHRVKWQVYAYISRNGADTWTRALLEGPGRTGRWRGCAILDDSTGIPDWLPVPRDWIERAEALAATLSESGGSTP